MSHNISQMREKIPRFILIIKVPYFIKVPQLIRTWSEMVLKVIQFVKVPQLKKVPNCDHLIKLTIRFTEIF